MAHRVVLIAVARVKAVGWHDVVHLVVADGAIAQAAKARDDRRQQQQEHNQGFQIGREPAFERNVKNGLVFGCWHHSGNCTKYG